MRSPEWSARLRVVVLVVVALLVTAACSSPATDTSKAAHDGLAATATARQALDQLDRGRSTHATAEVTLEATATELSTALSETATVTPEPGEQANRLVAVRLALADAAAAVALARSTLAAGEDFGPAAELVETAERVLRDVAGRVGPPR
ncbi:hypothetical protein [Aeromicrobium sp.]|uniref:hypothetical protein n=1 Tax=Aeromicrobium sp. TaxID=1871063 RepID=UPI0028AD4034|nr:hypothetical protein [Aeromicrobium sp.]